ncbi:MAG: carbon monoxide dehydrogenase [Acidocella sp. 20-57-95]|nr:MAG: carbon monoxide dehydrogenase [Acidocella sp. 20-57-95]OYV62692.1 MAG: carbon monoxide dehydrogenase [Acidocella sp. 21-58-7]HQT65293.1 xanthine dehydrogenase family protein subunit M [Acidocella sp.]HQU03775.1 xanthine dehydrogenase family protein subunit M [Acidocella sp.]
MYDFTYAKPANIADAVKTLAADAEAKALAGGMTFIPVLKQRLNKPSTVVDLSALGLNYIKLEGGKLIVGAMTPHGTVAASPEVKKALPALAELAGNIGDRQVRYRGTIGGSLANNDPSACYPAAVLALGATIKTNTRTIAADDYFQGMFTTALNPDEIITEVHFPLPEKAAYAKFANPASRYAMVGVFVAKFASGVRVAITGAGQNGVFRHAAFEAALSKSFTPDALNGITTPVDEMNADIHGSAPYRAHLVGVMAKRAVAAAG